LAIAPSLDHHHRSIGAWQESSHGIHPSACLRLTTNLTDEIRARSEGREITDADQATFHAAEQGEVEALEALKGTAPQTIAGARAAIEYLVKIDDGVDPDLSCTFLETMLNSPLLAN
jgi:hypothetical protein